MILLIGRPCLTRPGGQMPGTGRERGRRRLGAPSRMLVTEKVFGFLLAALGVQLALSGLADVGVIHLTGH